MKVLKFKMKKAIPHIYIAGFLLILLVFTQYRPDIPPEELKRKYADNRSRFIGIDGMQVHYMIEGRGAPLVLIHGTSSSLHAWEEWARTLKNDFTIVRLDLPAFGLTGPNAAHDYSIDYYVAFLDSFVGRLQLDSFYLAGVSLGGNIAWQYAVAFPQKVKKLILIDASGYPRSTMPRLFRIAQMPVVPFLLKHFTPRWLVRKNLREVFYNDALVTDHLITRHHELALRQGNRDAFLARVRHINKTNHEMIKKINTPTLIMWGREDTWIPLEHAYRFKNDIAGSELKIYDHVGHVPNEEAPQKTATDAREFLLR
jgi:pimeloyl-ACP methyl ester carboxylesterase